MAEFRAPRSDCQRMLHLRAHTFAPVTQKANKPLIRLVNFRNGRETPLPQHSRPGRRMRDGPWRDRNRSREGVNWSDNPAIEAVRLQNIVGIRWEHAIVRYGDLVACEEPGNPW